MAVLSAHQTFALQAAVDPLLAAVGHLAAVRAHLHVALLAVVPLAALGDAVLAAALHADLVVAGSPRAAIFMSRSVHDAS